MHHAAKWLQQEANRTNRMQAGYRMKRRQGNETSRTYTQHCKRQALERARLSWTGVFVLHGRGSGKAVQNSAVHLTPPPPPRRQCPSCRPAVPRRRLASRLAQQSCHCCCYHQLPRRRCQARLGGAGSASLAAWSARIRPSAIHRRRSALGAPCVWRLPPHACSCRLGGNEALQWD